MADFTPITTQEELDKVVNAAVQAAVSKFSDYEAIKADAVRVQQALADANKVISGHANTVNELNAKISGLELSAAKIRIANELGLPFELGARLTGSNEDEIKADAQSLQKTLLNINQPAPPMFNPNPAPTSTKTEDEALLELLSKMKGE